MRPILVLLPAKPTLIVLAALGLLLVLLGYLPRFRKSQLGSQGWFFLVAAIVVGRVGSGQWNFVRAFPRPEPWDAIPIYSYGVMLCLSLVFGWYLALRLAEQEGLPREKMASCYMQTAIWAVIGARLLYVITNWSEFSSNLIDIVKVNRGGLVAYGGFLGGFLASLIFCKRNGIPLLRWADNAVPSISLGLAITRIGCFLFGCDFGKRTDLPWAVSFPGPSSMARYGSPAFEHHVRHYDLASTATASLPVHPTQLYESLLGLLLLGLCLVVRKRRKTNGMVFVAFVIGYGIPRFLLEFLRDDEQRGGLGDWSTSQIIGLATALAGIILLLVLRSRGSSHPPDRAALASTTRKAA